MNRQLLKDALTALRDAGNTNCDWNFVELTITRIKVYLAKPATNADKMTREEWESLCHRIRYTGSESGYQKTRGEGWDRIEAIQSAPFMPDWSLKPEGCTGYAGHWYHVRPGTTANLEPGEFYIPAPSNPSDAELSAMWEKLDRDKRVQILRDAGVEV